MEYDTEKQQTVVHLPLYCNSSRALPPQQQSPQPSSSWSQSQPIAGCDVNNHHSAVVSYHNSDIAEHRNRYDNDGWIGWLDGRDLQRGSTTIMSNYDCKKVSNNSGQSIDDDASKENESSQSKSFQRTNRSQQDSDLLIQKLMHASLSATSLHGEEESIVNSNCVPVEGRLTDLEDHGSFSETDEESTADDEEGGIVILGESTEEEFDSSTRQSLEGNEGAKNKQPLAEAFNQASMYKNDPIVFAAAARVNANPHPVNNVGSESLGFEQLLHEADDHSEASEEESKSEEKIEHASNDENDVPGPIFWGKNLFPPHTRRPEPITAHPQASSMQRYLHTPATTATRIGHDKFVVKMEIYPSDANNSRLDMRDVMDVMANIELMHLWFDPVPAVFDAAVKDGSGSSSSPQSSPINSLEDDTSCNRQYDGQWVEISTPLLSVPSDSKISGCLRDIRVSLRSVIGFPARIRSMIFVERCSGRIGMTLGPYPDGFLFQKGTMAYHSFKVEASDVENGTTENRRCITITDEVRLQRGGDEGLDETRRTCFIFSILRFLLGFLEWILLFRWYQPDLASYIQQTKSSLEKLRNLIERGESSAYAGGQLIVDGDDSGDAINTPLLG